MHSPFPETRILPVHMDIKLAIAESLVDGTKEDFTAYMTNILQKMQDFKHSELLNGVKGSNESFE